MGENHFCIINTAEVTDYTPLDNPGQMVRIERWPPPIPAGNVILNTVDGARCYGVIVARAPIGEPIEVAIAGRVLIECGETITVGDLISSSTAATAQVADGSEFVLGTANDSGVAGDLISMTFAPQGPLT